MKLYLTSSPIGAYRQWGQQDYPGVNPANNLVEELKKDWKDDAKCLLISADPDAFEMNDAMARDFEEKFAKSELSVDRFDVCDHRNGQDIIEDIFSYDFIVLGGGHVPTQNAFFNELELTPKIQKFDGIVMGISAGTMNCAKIVYAQPESEGESIDPNYERFIEGLGLTKFMVIPHYQAIKDDILDGKRVMEEISYLDSIGREFYALTDGSFILQRDGVAKLHGEAYLVKDGGIRKICENGQVLDID